MKGSRLDAPLLTGLAALIAWLILFWSGPLINDPAWQLWIGRQINAGATLYGDILEVNPPLWFWIGAGIERLPGLSGIHWLAVAFAAYGAAALTVALRLVEDRAQRWAIVLGLAATLFLTSPYAHLQREQFLLMSVLPYLALTARRAEGEPVGRGIAFTAGLLAAPGLALKHHFLLFPAVLEGWLLWRRRRFDIRPEHLALAAGALAYAAAVLLFAPTYLGTMLPLLRASYHGYNPPLWTLFIQPALVVAVFALVAALLRRGKLSPLAGAAAAGTLAFGLVFILQGKDFHYQAIPALGLALVTMVAILLDRQSRDGRLIALLGIAVALMVPFKAGGARHDRVFVAAVSGLKPGEGVAMISASQALAWPAMYERDLRYRARTMGLWMVLSPWQAELARSGDPTMAALGTAVRREQAAEIACHRPALVVIDTRYKEEVPGGDLLNWFLAEPRFRDALAGYRETQATDYLRRFVPAGGRGGTCVVSDLTAVTRPLPGL
ncbi:hypothetical protein [Sphingomonas humi]|uniref:Glycosyltransferase RgtA/B/C/D-like domain-containing protein n=1 Tax=Sphingomonas humi TaxID=335630 RepID=A0ABP7RYB2_9SPHN